MSSSFKPAFFKRNAKPIPDGFSPVQPNPLAGTARKSVTAPTPGFVGQLKGLFVKRDRTAATREAVPERPTLQAILQSFGVDDYLGNQEKPAQSFASSVVESDEQVATENSAGNAPNINLSCNSRNLGFQHTPVASSLTGTALPEQDVDVNNVDAQNPDTAAERSKAIEAAANVKRQLAEANAKRPIPKRSKVPDRAPCVHLPEFAALQRSRGTPEIGSRRYTKEQLKADVEKLQRVAAAEAAKNAANAESLATIEESNVLHKPSRDSSIWAKLKNRFLRNPPVYLKEKTVAGYETSMPCVAHSCVRVQMNGQSHAIYANQVKFNIDAATLQKPDEAESARVQTPYLKANEAVSLKSDTEAAEALYVVGQSPAHYDACVKLIIASLEKRQGVYEIVSPDTHTQCVQSNFQSSAHDGPINPIINQLMSRQSDALGENYEILSVKPEVVEQDFACFSLTVLDKIRQVKFEVPLTQVGVSSDHNALKSDAIRLAYWRLNGHIANNTRIDASRKAEPVVVSKDTVGPSAALVTFHAIYEMIDRGQIKTQDQLSMALENIVGEGQASCGLGFVETSAQLEVLGDLLYEHLKLRNDSSAAPASVANNISEAVR